MSRSIRLDGDYLYVQLATGTKLAALRANPRACVHRQVIDPYMWSSGIALAYSRATDPNEREGRKRAFGALSQTDAS